MAFYLPVIQALPDFACVCRAANFSGLAFELFAALPAGDFDISLPSRYAKLLPALGTLEILVFLAFRLLSLLDPEELPDRRSLLKVPAVLGGTLCVIP